MTLFSRSPSRMASGRIKCRNSSLYSGIPLKQNKEYWVGNQKELDACILDSINKTMLENLGPSYTVYYADAEGGDLKLSDVGVTIPANVPYSSFWNY